MSLLVIVGCSPTHPQCRPILSKVCGIEKYLGYLFIGDSFDTVQELMKRQMKRSFHESAWKWVQEAFGHFKPMLDARKKEAQMITEKVQLAEAIEEFEAEWRRKRS